MRGLLRVDEDEVNISSDSVVEVQFLTEGPFSSFRLFVSLERSSERQKDFHSTTRPRQTIG